MKLRTLFCAITCVLGAKAYGETPVAKEIILDRGDEFQTKVLDGSAPIAAPKRATDASGGRNLPVEFINRSRTRLLSTSSVVVIPSSSIRETLETLIPGEQLEVVISHSIIAFPDEEAPVISVVQSGPLAGAKLIGSSKLERNSQRIFVEFKRIVVRGTIYNTKASAVTESGQPGFEGVHHSKEASLFAGDFISSAVAAYFDGLVPRTTNPYGQVVQDSSFNSAAKLGLAAGAMSSAKRFQEKLQKAPEYSEISGPIAARVLILEPAITAGSTSLNP